MKLAVRKRNQLHAQYDRIFYGPVVVPDTQKFAELTQGYREQPPELHGEWEDDHGNSVELDPIYEGLALEIELGREAGDEVRAWAAATVLAELKGTRPTNLPDRFKPSVEAVGELYLAERNRVPRTAMNESSTRQAKCAYRWFDQWIEGAPMESANVSQARTFVDSIACIDRHWSRSPKTQNMRVRQLVALGGSGLSDNTLNRYVSDLSVLYKWAKERQYLDTDNPFLGLKRSKKGMKKPNRQAWEPEEIIAFLKEVPNEPPWFWIIRILLFTGARLEEIAQLHVSDIKTDPETGCRYINITDEGDRKTKRQASNRRVPVHSKLINIGFLEYLSSVPPDGRLFPELKAGGPDKRYGYYLSKMQSKYRQRAGITREGLVIHSLRNTVITRLMRVGVGEHDVALLVGHETGNITFSTYADGMPIKYLRDIIEQLSHPGVPDEVWHKAQRPAE